MATASIGSDVTSGALEVSSSGAVLSLLISGTNATRQIELALETTNKDSGSPTGPMRVVRTD